MAVLGAELVRYPRGQALHRRPAQGAVEQRVDRQRRDAEHDDLAEGVVAADVDQDHVHHVGAAAGGLGLREVVRSEEHTSELQSLMRSSYAVFCLKTKQQTPINTTKSHRPS